MLRNRRMISIPIVLGVISLCLSVALLVGWILVIVQHLYTTQKMVEGTWLLVLGSVSFAVIISVLALLSVFLMREIRLVNRQSGFIDSVTHEFKSPLASLKLCLQTLERNDLASTQRGLLERMMSDDVERLTVLIDHVLDASRLSQHREVHSLEEVALADLVESCAVRILRYYRREPESIQVHVPRDLVLVTDRTALETVLKNLMDNAVKYSLASDQPVEVTVGARRDGSFVHIEIRDRGVGIARKYLKRVFDRFYRVPDELVLARQGTGLGLYVVSMLVRLLGGKLTLHSEGVGKGVVVSLRIPTRSGKVSKVTKSETVGDFKDARSREGGASADRRG